MAKFKWLILFLPDASYEMKFKNKYNYNNGNYQIN